MWRKIENKSKRGNEKEEKRTGKKRKGKEKRNENGKKFIHMRSDFVHWSAIIVFDVWVFVDVQRFVRIDAHHDIADVSLNVVEEIRMRIKNTLNTTHSINAKNAKHKAMLWIYKWMFGPITIEISLTDDEYCCQHYLIINEEAFLHQCMCAYICNSDNSLFTSF